MIAEMLTERQLATDYFQETAMTQALQQAEKLLFGMTRAEKAQLL